MPDTGAPLFLPKMALDGERLPSAKFNEAMEILNTDLSAVPAIGARVYHNANQSITDATVTFLSFNNERWDTNSFHDNTTNNSRLTCPLAGKHLIVCTLEFASNATGFRQANFKLNNTTYIGGLVCVSVTGAGTFVGITTIYNLALNDYIQVEVYQNSGGALNVTTGANYSPEFMIVRIGA